MRLSHFLTALPIACQFAGAAQAQAPAAAPCTKPLSMVNEIQMESRGAGPSTVPVEINGTKQSLTFATAGTTTQLTEAAAKQLGLAVTRGDTVLYDDNGNAYRDQVTVSKLVMGSLQGSNVNIPISPGRGGRGGGGGDGGEGFGGGGRGGGLFSLNHMLPYDVDVDFGTDKLRFFSQDHCAGGVLYWQASSVWTAPITVEGGRITVPAELDGKAVTGVIDTTAPATSVKVAVAEKVLGLTLGGADTPATSPGNYTHTFASLRIGTLGLRNRLVRIGPNANYSQGDAAAEARARSQAAQAAMAKPEVRIGMDILRLLHVYMAFGENKLYLTPASSKPAATTAAAPAPAN